MTTTLANLLAGVDMEGGENFCDSVYNFLKNQGKDINLFTNSGFGVWSQSDTNKGLGTLPFDSGSVEPVVGETLTDPNTGATGKVIWLEVTGGTWGGTNAAGNISLGAVTGTFQDNSDITGSVGGANMLTVNGDESIGRTNDPMNNDDTADWTATDCNLAFAAAEYTITRTAASQIINKTCSLEVGKIYKIEIDIKDGTEAGVDILGYTNNVAGVVIYPYFTTAAGWASVSWTFKAQSTDAAATIGIVAYIIGGGNTIEVRRFSVYEITPCCTGADTTALDGWLKIASLDIYREYWTGTTKDGSFYSLAIVPSLANDYIVFPTVGNRSEWMSQFESRPVTFGAWVYASTATHARLYLWDDGAYYSSYHSGTPGWEWLEFTHTFTSVPANVVFGLRTTAVGDVDGTTIVYVSQPMCIFGWSLGEGMYQPRLQEIIWLEAIIPSNKLNGLLAQSDIATTTMDLEGDSDAMLPKGAKAIYVSVKCNDSGSAADVTAPRVYLRADGTADFMLHAVGAGLANDAHFYGEGWQGCNVGGDYDYYYDATGAGTLDIDEFSYHGIQVN